MTRLDKLKEELETVKQLRCMAYYLKEAAAEYYETEIRAIECYGAPNREIKP